MTDDCSSCLEEVIDIGVEEADLPDIDVDLGEPVNKPTILPQEQEEQEEEEDLPDIDF